jgi:DNA-binding PadR family transcriptional regulator
MDRVIAKDHEPGAMRSSIGWALLGLVIERPSYGYELVQRFQRTYGETLVLSSRKRIYTALETLRVRSLIEEVESAPQPRALRQPKPHYRATPQGIRAYQEWLFLQLEEERQRQRMFVRQLAMLEPEAALGVIERYEQECLEDTREGPAEATERGGIAERLAEEDEHLALGVRLSWIEYARKELNALIAQQDSHAEGMEEL